MKHSSSTLEFSPGAAGLLLDAETPLDWMALAACRDASPAIFFPPPSRTAAPAKRVCAGCPVQAECLEYALENGERFGIWGGMSERERRRLRPAPPAPGRYCGNGRHLKDAAGTGADGRCLACRRESGARKRADERAARTGSASPRSGRRLAA
jgi:WhiB family redox-sensing transcriptional regulator